MLEGIEPIRYFSLMKGYYDRQLDEVGQEIDRAKTAYDVISLMREYKRYLDKITALEEERAYQYKVFLV